MRISFVAAAAFAALMSAVPVHAQIILFSNVESGGFTQPLISPSYVPAGAYGFQPSYYGLQSQPLFMSQPGVQFAPVNSWATSNDISTIYAVAAMLDAEQANDARSVQQPRADSQSGGAFISATASATSARISAAESRIAAAEAKFDLITTLLPLVPKLLPVLFPDLDLKLPLAPGDARLDQINAKLDKLLAHHGITGPTPGPPASGSIDLLDALIRILQGQLGENAPVIGSGRSVSAEEPTGGFGPGASVSNATELQSTLKALKEFRTRMVAEQNTGNSQVSPDASTGTSQTLSDFSSAVEQVSESIENATAFNQAAAAAVAKEELQLQELRRRLAESRKTLSNLKARLP